MSCVGVDSGKPESSLGDGNRDVTLQFFQVWTRVMGVPRVHKVLPLLVTVDLRTRSKETKTVFEGRFVGPLAEVRSGHRRE